VSSPETPEELEQADTVSTAIDIAAGLFLAAVAIGAIAWLVPLHTKVSSTVHDIQPGFIPSLSAWIVLVLSTWLFVVNTYRLRASARVGTVSGRTVVVEVVVWSAVAALAMFGLSVIGFLIVAPILICGGMVFAGFRNWRIIGLLSVLFPLLIDQAAWIIFTVDLP